MRAVRIALVLLAIATVTGCMKARAQKPDPPMQALAMPEPPNRVIIPAVLPEPVDPPPAPAAPAPAPNRPPATSSRPPDRPAASTPTTPPVEPAPAPGVVLQTRESAPGELERQTRLQINTAKQNLDKINSKQLNANAKAQFDMAHGLIRQAEAALTSKNFLVARDLADKAAVLAKELAR